MYMHICVCFWFCVGGYAICLVFIKMCLAGFWRVLFFRSAYVLLHLYDLLDNFLLDRVYL